MLAPDFYLHLHSHPSALSAPFNWLLPRKRAGVKIFRLITFLVNLELKPDEHFYWSRSRSISQMKIISPDLKPDSQFTGPETKWTFSRKDQIRLKLFSKSWSQLQFNQLWICGSNRVEWVLNWWERALTYSYNEFDVFRKFLSSSDRIRMSFKSIWWISNESWWSLIDSQHSVNEP